MLTGLFKQILQSISRVFLYSNLFISLSGMNSNQWYENQIKIDDLIERL